MNSVGDFQFTSRGRLNISIADNATLIETDLEHSVVLESAKIVGIHQRIIDSVIGQRAQLTVAPRRPKALRFMIGDDCQIELT